MPQTTETALTDSGLHSVLERARAVGFLGPGPLSVHVEHAAAYGDALPTEVRSVVDIGSGGGVPGLPIALSRPELSVTLLDAAQRRTAFLLWALTELELDGRVATLTGRAEVIGRQARYRRTFDAVVSRGFGPPASTLECAAGLVRTGGVILVSEPPDGRDWPDDPIAELGLTRRPHAGPIAIFEARDDLSDNYPRSAKVMKRDPLFDL